MNMSEEIKSGYDQEALERLLEFDFSKEETFDLESNFKVVDEFSNQLNKDKPSKEDKTIETLGSKYVDPEYFEKLEYLKNNIKSYIKRYSANTDYMKNLLDNYSENKETVDKIFAICTFMLRMYKETTNNLFFNFRLTKAEYNMIMDTVVKNSQVTGNEVLLEGMDQLLTYLQEWRSIYKETQGDQNVELNLPINIGSIVLLYHFLSKKTVKGFDNPFYVMRSIMYKLKETNDLHQAYVTIMERINEAYVIWTGSITPINDTAETKSEETE